MEGIQQNMTQSLSGLGSPITNSPTKFDLNPTGRLSDTASPISGQEMAGTQWSMTKD